MKSSNANWGDFVGNSEGYAEATGRRATASRHGSATIFKAGFTTCNRAGKKAPARSPLPAGPAARGPLRTLPRFPPREKSGDECARHDPACRRHREAHRGRTHGADAFSFVPLGEFRFKAGDSGFVEITNGGTDGRVVIRWRGAGCGLGE